MLKNNIYRLRDSGRTWLDVSSVGLIDFCFNQIDIDQCVFIKDGVIILVYVNDCVILSKNIKGGGEETMENPREIYMIKDKGKIEECLGIQLEHSGGIIRMSQPLLINRIVDTVPGMRK